MLKLFSQYGGVLTCVDSLFDRAKVWQQGERLCVQSLKEPLQRVGWGDRMVASFKIPQVIGKKPVPHCEIANELFDPC